MKGCASFAGIMKTGYNMASMLNNQFPHLIDDNSIERTEVECNFSILDEMKTMKPLHFTFFLQFVKLIDCFPQKDVFLVNPKYSLGETINSAHAKRYEDSLDEKFEFKSSQHYLFYSIVN